MFDFEEALELISEQTILCVGDLMLDDFVYGDVTRISPEAPTPVLSVRHNAVEVGGAGNVARNIAALGACIFVGLVGNDEAGRAVNKRLPNSAPFISDLMMTTPTRPRQGALCFGTPFGPSDAGRLGDHRARRRGEPGRGRRPCRGCDGESRRCGVVRLCQRHAHRARHPRHHRGRAASSTCRLSSIRKATITGSIAVRR